MLDWIIFFVIVLTVAISMIVLRINAFIVFLAFCVGQLLVTTVSLFSGPGTTIADGTYSVDTSWMVWNLILQLLPVILVGFFMFHTIEKRKMATIHNGIIASITALIGVWFAVQTLTADTFSVALQGGSVVGNNSAFDGTMLTLVSDVQSIFLGLIGLYFIYLLVRIRQGKPSIIAQFKL